MKLKRFLLSVIILASLISSLFAQTGTSQQYEFKPVDKRFIHLPVKTGGPRVWMSLSVDGVSQYDFQIEIAPSAPDFYVTIEAGRWMGKGLVLTAENVPETSQWRQHVKHSDVMSDEETVYTEKYRPQFHFSPRRGWTNDPNGLVFYKGTYHLFFQHNPFGIMWGNMTWGHAISDDLVHWKELPDAVLPDHHGVVYSGSALVDWNNTSGLQKNPVVNKKGKITNPPLVALYTSYGPELRIKGKEATQSIAYSLDEGVTWLKYPGNPVVPHMVAHNRDPKVFWYHDDRSSGNQGHWVMVLYLKEQDYAVLVSNDLIHWEKTCDILGAGCTECPDMFRLPVDGNRRNQRWVFWGADGAYLTGDFDGRVFTKQEGPYYTNREGENDYAAQTYSDIPEKDGRRIQISWLRSDRFPGTPFNQQMSVPRNLTLRTTPEGIRLFIGPVREIEKLRTSSPVKFSGTLSGEPHPLESGKMKGEQLDLTVVFKLNDQRIQNGPEEMGLEIRGIKITYDAASQTLDVAGVKAPLKPLNHKIELRLLFDALSVEAFANDGIVAVSKYFVPDLTGTPVVFGTKGLAGYKITGYPLNSAWTKGK